MGANESKGFGLVNLTNKKVNIVLSMAAPHYYENNIKPGEIFYRHPGSIHYTVCVSVWKGNDSEMNDEKKVGKIIGAVGKGVAGVAMGVGSALLAPIVMPFAVVAAADEIEGELLERGKSDYAEMKCCYGGGEGTWLLIQERNGRLYLEKSTKREVLEKGKSNFTTESRENYNKAMPNNK